MHTPRSSANLPINQKLSNEKFFANLSETLETAKTSKGLFDNTWWHPIKPTEINVEKGYMRINNYDDHDFAGYSAQFYRTSPETLEITVKGVGPYCTDMNNAEELKKLLKLLQPLTIDSF